MADTPSPWCDGPSAPAARDRLAHFLAAATAASAVEVEALTLLPHGAVQENWLVVATCHGGRLAGRQHLVLRANAATALGLGLDRAAEFAVLRAVHAAGVKVPEPLLLCAEASVIGKPFFLMRWLPGEAAPQRITAGSTGSAPNRIARQLAAELARLHAIRPPGRHLAALGAAPADAAEWRLAECARLLAADDEPHPVAEWGLRWLARHRPAPVAPVLCHGDFRTGNYLVDAQGLTALLDWEFASWSDPAEDIGWFCLGCWRFGAYGREAGGIAARADFLSTYEAASGCRIEPERLRWWEVLAALRWLVIALRQRDRALIAGEHSLDLALTGRRPAECELEILKLTAA